jgi:hypothetical protein
MRKALLSVVLGLFIHSVVEAQSITSVTISPDPVLSTQNWFLTVQGNKPGSVTLMGAEFSYDGNNLWFDILFGEGVGIPELTPFQLTKTVFPMPPGSYTLDVGTYLDFVQRDREVVQFTIVPEPASIGMVLGAMLLLRRSRGGALA